MHGPPHLWIPDPSEGFPGSLGSSGSIIQHPQLTQGSNPRVQPTAAPSLGVIHVGDLSGQAREGGARLTPTRFCSHFSFLSFSAVIDFRVLTRAQP